MDIFQTRCLVGSGGEWPKIVEKNALFCFLWYGPLKSRPLHELDCSFSSVSTFCRYFNKKGRGGKKPFSGDLKCPIVDIILEGKM